MVLILCDARTFFFWKHPPSHTRHIFMLSSQAAPFVTGVVALYLEASPVSRQYCTVLLMVICVVPSVFAEVDLYCAVEVLLEGLDLSTLLQCHFDPAYALCCTIYAVHCTALGCTAPNCTALYRRVPTTRR